MPKLSEKDFLYMKEVLNEGRLAPGGFNLFLVGALTLSLMTVGIGYFVVTVENTVIGWDNLPTFWQSIFKIQPVLFGIHIVVIFLTMMKNNFSQMLLAIAMVFFSYKMVLDPFIMISMFYINDGVYEQYAPITFFLIGLGFALHIFLIIKEFIDKKKEKQKVRQKEKKVSIYFVGFLFFLVSITGYAIRNNLFGDFETLFFLAVATVVYFAVLIGAVEFVIGVYCLVRFPSFRINPPSNYAFRKTGAKKKKK